ncbi:MAG: hypothetical protein GF307_12335 [candidate division Zixibacteria bacterium]|nr:hypothetical protein [candidate division Zixibacteria bacterium]
MPGMDSVLHNIKSVPGVRGVVVLDRKESKIYRRFPARYEDNDLLILATAIGNLYNSGLNEGLLTMNFSNGLAMTFIGEHYSLLALAQDEVDTIFLKTAIRQQVLHLIRKANSGSESSGSLSRSRSNEEDLELLLESLNQVSHSIRKILGGYIASRELKRCRDKLIKQYPFLKNLYVDNSGNAAAINKPLTDNQKDMVRSFGELVSGYYAASARLSPKMAALQLKDILREYSFKLSQIGFWS